MNNLVSILTDLTHKIWILNSLKYLISLIYSMVKYWLQLTNWQLVITNRVLLESYQRFLEVNFYSYLWMYTVHCMLYSSTNLIILFKKFRIMYKIISNNYCAQGTLVHCCSTSTLVWRKVRIKKLNNQITWNYFIILWYNYWPHGALPPNLC